MRPHTHINLHWYCSYTQIHNPLMYNVQLPYEHTHSCITPPPDVHAQTCKLTHLCRHIHLHTFTDIIHRNSHTLVDMHTHRPSYIFIYMNTHRYTHSTSQACILPQTCPFTHLHWPTHTYTHSHSCLYMRLLEVCTQLSWELGNMEELCLI